MCASTNSPPLVITMGDPAGIGPEIVAKAWFKARDTARMVCIGSAAVLQAVFQSLGIPGSVRRIQAVEEASFSSDALDVIDLWEGSLEGLLPGKAQAQAGDAMFRYIVHGIELAKAGRAAAVVTSPINKEALALANHHFDGHTEIFAKFTGARAVTMMLASGHFRVTHVSTHCALMQAIERCKTARVLEVIELTNTGLKDLGIAEPRIAVAGLNPHSGEGGLFGKEEKEQIQPAIDMARRKAINVYPWPAPGDTVFYRMNEEKEFDAVIAQYHDQGHIPAKLVDFFGGVNITLGLPIIRTSVDHGTAYNIVGKGIAREASLLNAMKLAEQLARSRKKM